MADESNEQAAAPEQAPETVADEQTEVGEETEAYWKQQARMWESRAKKSKPAEEELERIKGGTPELKKAISRAESAERELEEMRASIEKREAAHAIATDTGTPVELLEFFDKPEQMEAVAKEYAAHMPRVHAAAFGATERIIRNDGVKQSPRDAFADWAAEQFHR